MISLFCKNADRCSLKPQGACVYAGDCPTYEADLKRQLVQANEPKQPKYRNERVTVDGMTFDSKLEMRRWFELRVLEKAKKISGLQRQVKFVLIEKSEYGREVSYVADFTYIEGGGMVVEDTKSEATKTPLYKLKKRLMAEKYGIKIKEVEA